MQNLRQLFYLILVFSYINIHAQDSTLRFTEYSLKYRIAVEGILLYEDSSFVYCYINDLYSSKTKGKYFFKGDTLILKSEFKNHNQMIINMLSKNRTEDKTLEIEIVNRALNDNPNIPLTYIVNDSSYLNIGKYKLSCLNCLQDNNTFQLKIGDAYSNIIHFKKAESDLKFSLKEPDDFYQFFNSIKFGLLRKEGIYKLDQDLQKIKFIGREEEKFILLERQNR